MRRDAPHGVPAALLAAASRAPGRDRDEVVRRGHGHRGRHRRRRRDRRRAHGRRPEATFLVEEPEVYGLTGAPRGLARRPGRLGRRPDRRDDLVHPRVPDLLGVHRAARVRRTRGRASSSTSRSDELFAARVRRGGDARRAAIHASDADDHPARADRDTGFPYDRGATLDRQMAVFGSILSGGPRHPPGRLRGRRLLPCRVRARRRASGSSASSPGTPRAGTLIAQEAGATVTAIDGSAWTPATADILIAAPELHPVLLEAIRSADPLQRIPGDAT